jgi:hypothetical protein
VSSEGRNANAPPDPSTPSQLLTATLLILASTRSSLRPTSRKCEEQGSAESGGDQRDREHLAGHSSDCDGPISDNRIFKFGRQRIGTVART